MAIELPIALPDTLLSRLSDFLELHMRLYFPKAGWRDLERGIAAAARESGYAEAQAYIHWLLAAPLSRTQVEGLASHLTVGETYFFREGRSLDVLEQQILPELLRERAQTERHLRIWSAGCCSGEERNSVAMLLDQLLPDFENWNLTILATDINPQFLGKAAQGTYTAHGRSATRPAGSGSGISRSDRMDASRFNRGYGGWCAGPIQSVDIRQKM